MKLYLGCDHAAFKEKKQVKDFIEKNPRDFEGIVDLGTLSEERCNYPDFAIKVAKKVQEGDCLGILLCGSGIGVSMVANRFSRVRAALCRTPEEAKLAREHNDANVLCLGARINSIEEIVAIITAFFDANFEGKRHTDRIKIFDGLGERIEEEVEVAVEDDEDDDDY